MNKFLSLLILVASFQTAMAQSLAGSPLADATPHYSTDVDKDKSKIAGSIADAKTLEPIPYATIAVLDPATGTPVDGTLADGGGKFSMDKVKHGEYSIQISFIGYETKTISKVKVGDKKVELGQILLSESEETLQEVTIEGQRAMIEEKVDRTVYNAEQDASNKGGDAADVLRKVPMLTVDLDGNVSMRGSQNIRVLINNRPSTITAGSVADALKQIPADMIKSVEVITSPSAKYDAEGSAGIINIITKKNTLQGGSLNVDTGVGLRGTNLGLNGNYKVGKMGFSLGGFGRAGYNAPGSFENTQTTRQGADELVTRQSANTRNNMMFGRYSFGWDWDINEKNFVNGSVMYGVRNWHSFQDDLTTRLYENNVLQSSSLRNVETTDNSGTVDVNLNYTHTFGKPQQELSLLTQYSRNNRTNDFINQVFNGDGQTVDTQLKNINQSYNQESTVQLDYQNSVGENQMLEVGAKQIMRQVTSDYETYTAAGNGPFTRAENTSLSNVFNYDQQVSAGYLSYTYTTANKYSIKAGTRYEYTTISADFENSDEAVEIDPYGVLVPSVNLSKILKSGNSVKLAYNRRIQRPSLQFLNPNVQNANPAFRTVGNPELDPEFTNNFEASYNTYFKSSSLSVTAFMRNTNNSIQAVREQVEEGVLETSYFNIGQEDAYGASIFGSLNLARKLTLSGGTDFYYADMSNNVADPTQQANNSGWVANIRAFGNYKLGQGWALQGFGFYRGRQVQLQGRQSGFGIYSLNLRKEFSEGRGSIGFGAENFFSKTMKMRNELETPTFNQTSTNVMHNMNFKVNFSYRIGKMTMDAGPRRRKKSVNNDDLKGGGESSAQGGGTLTGGAPQGNAPQGGAPTGGKPVGGTPQADARSQAPRPAQGSGQPQQGKPAKAQTTVADSVQAGVNALEGRWQGSMGPIEMVLDLTTEGNILKGSVQTPRGEQPITDGVVNGSSFTFNVSTMGNNILYTGKIEGDQITLRSSSQGQPKETTLLRVQ